MVLGAGGPGERKRGAKLYEAEREKEVLCEEKDTSARRAMEAMTEGIETEDKKIGNGEKRDSAARLLKSGDQERAMRESTCR